jgi:hypothetical protein
MSATAVPANAALVLSGLRQAADIPLTQVICSSLALHDEHSSRYAAKFLANLVSHENAGPLHSWLISDCLEPLMALNAASQGAFPSSDDFVDDQEPTFASLLNKETRRQMTMILQQLSLTPISAQ